MIEAEKIWDLMAGDYEDFTNQPSSYSNEIEWPCIQELLPGLEHAVILDVGCGTGRFSFHLEQYKPKKIVGIDVSEEMIRLANEKKSSRIIEFRKISVSDLLLLTEERYDLVFTSTATHYFPDLQKAFWNMAQVTKKNGVLLASVIHPVYTASYPIDKNDEWELRYLNRTVREYYQPWTRYGKSQNGAVCKSYHYTVSDYMNAIIRSGFEIEEIKEPFPPDSWKETKPAQYQAVVNEPLYMVIKAKRK